MAKKYTYPRMTPREYERARIHFDMPNTKFAGLIGVKWRQAQRYKDGSSAVPDAVAKLIRTAINHELSAEEIG